MTTTTKISTYQPNFNDPRVRKRAEAVLEWCDALKLSKAGRPVHHDKLFEVFSNPSRGLGEWLFANLLSQSGSYQPGKRSFSYKVKQRGYEKVYGLLNATPPTDVDVVVREYGPLIRGEVVPKYRDRGNRRYHPVQNIRRDVRQGSFAGWWDYDIEACAPTLVRQYVVQSKWFSGGGKNDDEHFPALSRLIDDKHRVRAEIAVLTGLDVQKVKELLSAVFFRGNPAPSPKAGIFRLLGCDLQVHQRFLKDPFVRLLRADARRLWLLALQFDKNERASQEIFGGRSLAARPMKTTSRRMSIYLSLERQVIQVIEDEAGRKKVPFVLMHDGLMSKDRLDVNQLVAAVKDKTGYSIRLSEVRLATGSDVDDDSNTVVLMTGGPSDQNGEMKYSEASSSSNMVYTSAASN